MYKQTIKKTCKSLLPRKKTAKYHNTMYMYLLHNFGILFEFLYFEFLELRLFGLDIYETCFHKDQIINSFSFRLLCPITDTCSLFQHTSNCSSTPEILFSTCYLGIFCSIVTWDMGSILSFSIIYTLLYLFLDYQYMYV